MKSVLDMFSLTLETLILHSVAFLKALVSKLKTSHIL